MSSHKKCREHILILITLMNGSFFYKYFLQKTIFSQVKKFIIKEHLGAIGLINTLFLMNKKFIRNKVVIYSFNFSGRQVRKKIMIFKNILTCGYAY